jgi:hypothetical protein
VLVGGRKARLAGRVSMDLITVDLTEVPEARVGTRSCSGARAPGRRRRRRRVDGRLRAPVRARAARPRPRDRGRPRRPRALS